MYDRYRVTPNGDLVITGARVGDSGAYACTARNAYATRTAPVAALTVLGESLHSPCSVSHDT